MARIQLEAVGLEFEETGNTIWVQGPNGTLLRIKCTGRIQVKPCTAPGAHADVMVPGDIAICVAMNEAAQEAAQGATRLGRRAGRVSTANSTVQAVGRRAGTVPAAQTLVRGTGRSSGRRGRGG